MAKRTVQEIGKAILGTLSDGDYHTYGYLERKVNTNWESIRNHCSYLNLFKAVEISDKGIKITKEGIEALKRFN